jgi:hypothetical protein
VAVPEDCAGREVLGSSISIPVTSGPRMANIEVASAPPTVVTCKVTCTSVSGMSALFVSSRVPLETSKICSL